VGATLYFSSKALRNQRLSSVSGADDGAFRNLRAQADQRRLPGRHHHRGFLEEAARAALQDQGLGVAAPEAGVHDIGAAGEERRDFRAVLPGEELGHLRGSDLHPRLQGLHRRLEIVPRVLAPGVVLVDAREFLDVGLHLRHVQRRGDVVHGRGGAGAEQVLVARVLEDARCTAVEEHGELLQLLGERRDREAVAAGDVADHHVHVVALHEVAILVHLLRGAAGFIHQQHLDRGPAESLLRIGRGQLAGVDGIDDELGAVARGHSEGPGGRAGQERHDADLDRLVLGGGRGDREGDRQSQRRCGGEAGDAARLVRFHGLLRPVGFDRLGDASGQTHYGPEPPGSLR
jgi:hypothetical protein